MNNKMFCKKAAVKYGSHELQLVPLRWAKLQAQRYPPGVCMHIIGMLKVPTCCNVAVVYICGKYWTIAKAAPASPKTLAVEEIECGVEKYT